jgi:hypothetical protein
VELTNLETTAMWAIKAVVCNDQESVIAELNANMRISPANAM